MKCPSCGNQLDAASHIGVAADPAVDDLTVCFYCEAWLVFTKVNPYEYRLMTAEEKGKLLATEYDKMVQTSAAVKSVRTRLKVTGDRR